MEANRGCYRFSTRNYNSGLFDRALDATYILHLEGNGRMPNIEEQLRNAHPTKTLHILHNPGFKKCKKELIEQVSYYDLMDGIMTIFSDALKRGYETILLLEDDFIFGPDLNKEESIGAVNAFLEKHKGEDFIYQLGAMPILRVQHSDNTSRVLGGAAHANIYSKAAMERLVEAYRSNEIKGHIDLYHAKYSITHQNMFMYNTPLIYQLFTKTENQEHWAGKDPLGKLQKFATDFYVSSTQLDRNVEPGTTIMYIFSLILPFLLLGLLGGIGYGLWRIWAAVFARRGVLNRLAS
jgi:hypothetical protein